MKKKGIALVLVLALALTLIGVTVAEDPFDKTNMEMSTSATGALKDGETFTVTVSNKQDVKLNALTFYLTFPTKDLTVKSVTWKLVTTAGTTDISAKEPTVMKDKDTVVAGGCSTADEANGSGKIGFYYLDVGAADGANATGKQYDKGAFQAVITFQVNKVHVPTATRTEVAESASIQLHEDSDGANGLIDTLLNWMNQEENAKVTFAQEALAYVLGDVTGDGKITAQDAQNVLRHVAHLSSTVPDHVDAADVTGDGKITAQDAQNILRHVAHLDSTLD